MDSHAHARPGVVLPARAAAPGALVLDDGHLLDALGRLAAADSPDDVAAAALSVLCGLPGVRAGLVARAPRLRGDPAVLASSGYACAEMAPGAVLPRDAGLPVTEAVRTGELQVVGPGPCWVAVPAGTGGALLLSLTGPPPDADGLGRLVRLGVLLAAALHRARRGEAARTDLLLLEEGLQAPAAVRSGVVARTCPYRAPLSGDVVEVVDDGPERWLLLADVCGRGHHAAVPADRLRAAFQACAPGARGPAEVLHRLDRVMRGGEEEFATALVVLVADAHVVLASAGHPAPLLLPGGRVPLVPAPPLGLRVDGPWPGARETTLVLGAGATLLAATDGLVDRGQEVDLDAVVAGLPEGVPAERLVDAVLAECDAAGPAQDDVTLVALTVC